jgi:hypothetical protein
MCVDTQAGRKEPSLTISQADAVMSTIANRMGISKAELLDPTSSDAAVKQAHGVPEK